jgi:tetratricopeptide (TPR) repeat protein
MIKISMLMLVAFAALSVAGAGVVGAQETIKDETGFEREATEVDLMMQTASQLMSAGQWQAAATELVKVTEKEPDRLDGWTQLASCYKALQQYDKAAAAYKAAHELKPKDLDLLSNLGYMQLNASANDEEQLKAAVTTYEQMLALDPLSYDANVHLGFVYQKQDDDEKAMAYYEKALEGNANDVQTMGSLAELYADNGRPDDSIAMYNRAIEASNDEAQKNQLRSKLGASLIQAKNFAKAAEVYGVLAEAVPDNPAHQFNCGISLMQIKEYQKAVPHFQAVIDLRPETASAYQRLAECYNEVGRYGEAISTAKTGLGKAKDGEKGGLYCAWGRALEKQTLYDEAMDVFQRAVNDPQYGDYARKQIERQQDLKKRAKMIKEQG